MALYVSETRALSDFAKCSGSDPAGRGQNAPDEDELLPTGTAGSTLTVERFANGLDVLLYAAA